MLDNNVNSLTQHLPYCSNWQQLADYPWLDNGLENYILGSILSSYWSLF